MNDWIRNNVAAIVLNGGRSARFGSDKAAIPLGGGRTLLEAILDLLGGIFDQVLVVGRPETAPPHPALWRAVADEVPGSGPLGGIHSGLKAMTKPLGFVVACDMPRLDPSVIRRQLAVARRSGADAVVPTWDGYLEPLHAVYSRRCLGAIERKLAEGERRIRSFFPLVDLFPWDVRAEGIAPEVFANINTRADYLAFIARSGRPSSP